MAIPPPPLDRRRYEDLVQQTQNLAETYTDWRVPPRQSPDAGLALIRIFSRMAALVSDRLNRSLDRNLLAYINLIGTQPIPAQPARVPLTFHLATGGVQDVLVPAYTQVAALMAEGDGQEVVFETEQDLLATTATLKSLFVLEDRHYYSDRSDHLDPQIATEQDAFLALKGTQALEHYLYLSCEEILNLPELTSLTITLDTDSAVSALKLKTWFETQGWQYWHQVAWEPLPTVRVDTLAAQVVITIDPLPKLLPVLVKDIKAKWLRVQINPRRRQPRWSLDPLGLAGCPHYRHDLPEVNQVQMAVSLNQTHPPKSSLFNTAELNLSKDFYPFGLAPQPNDSFALELDGKLIKPGVAIDLQVTLAHPPDHTEDLALVWEVGDGEQWQPIQEREVDETCFWSRDLPRLQFVEFVARATLHCPKTLNNGAPDPGERPAYWLRCRMRSGFYGRRAKQRKYVLYNDVTLTAEPITAGQTTITVDSIDELEVEDRIRLQSTGAVLQQEEMEIVEKISATKQLVLDHGSRHAYPAGTRVLSKITISDTISDTPDPPLVQSLSLTYRAILQRSATYLAYNDFNYCPAVPLAVRLQRAATAGDRVIYLDRVGEFTLGEFVKFEDNHPEKRQIELIDPGNRQIVFTEPLAYAHPRAARLSRCFHPLTPSVNRDSALYLGFDKAFSNRPNSLFLDIAPPHPEEVAPRDSGQTWRMNPHRLLWEYASPTGWQPLVVEDQTRALEESGLVQFIGPTDLMPSPYCGHRLHWLRIRKNPDHWETIPFALIYFFRWTIRFRRAELYGFMRYLLEQISGSADFAVPPRLRSVRTNTTWASQTLTLRQEELGSSNGAPHQRFPTTHKPILLNQVLEVEEGQLPSAEEQTQLRQQGGAEAIRPEFDENNQLERVWVRWQEVPDFLTSTAKDRHYLVDRQNGVVQFGDGQAGLIPPRGRHNIRLVQYQTGGGSQGNRSAQSIVELKTTIPYIDGVINWEAARGGNPQESLDRLKERAPQWLRHRDRAVTAQDFEDLTYQASVEVARVKVITPEMVVPEFSPLLEELWVAPNPGTTPAQPTNVDHEVQVMRHQVRGGWVQVIIVPHGQADQPTPSLALMNRVESFLRERFVPTMDLWVTGPQWQEISVNVEIVPQAVTTADAIRVAVEERLRAFLHPLTGGDRAQGWRFGRRPHHSDLYAILEAVPGVRYVRSLEIEPGDAAIDGQTLIYSGRHRVTLEFLEDGD
jgi:predicted phage baseplate assembly protein